MMINKWATNKRRRTVRTVKEAKLKKGKEIKNVKL